MRRWRAWWQQQPSRARFRLYTRLTLQISLIFTVGTIALSMGGAGSGPWPVLGTVLACLAGAVALDAQPALATDQRPTFRPRALPLAGAVLAVVWLAAVVVQLSTTDEPLATGARICVVVAAMVASLSLIAFLDSRWLVMSVLAVTSGVLIGSTASDRLVAVTGVLLLGCLVVGMMRLTLWSFDLLKDLERSKEVEAQLRLAEERLGFARDLHDVVGRGFSAIAVKSELAATLVRAGATDRAGAEMDEVKALAISSMEEMRTLVRGYRAPDLATEVSGAQSLLSAAGCRLEIEGEAAAVPAGVHEVAAWVVREGTTNIVKHSRATSAVLTLGAAGMSLRNNGATSVAGERSGLRGLAERLSAVGADLTAHADPDAETFTLEVRWETW